MTPTMNPAMTDTPSSKRPAELVGRGAYWQDLAVGQRFQTLRRTVTETDLVNFISVTGMLEAIFIDAHYEHGAMKGRPVPALLTMGLIEGLLFQSLIQGTGLALLETSVKAIKPVEVGDSVSGTVEIQEIVPTSKGNRAVVTSDVEIVNQDGLLVLTYRVKRLLAGRPAA